MKVKITKLNNLRCCSINSGYYTVDAVHFKIDDEDYFLHYSEEEYDHITLYKGRCKGHLEMEARNYGDLRGIIKFTRKPGCLKYVDTDYFVEKLKEYDLL
jgi:hypothetical protein